MAFKSTEGTTQPILLGKEPVPKPGIDRGPLAVGIDLVDGPIGDIATFSVIRPLDPKTDVRITYHRVPVLRLGSGGTMFETIVAKDAVVTWDRV